MAGAYGSMFPGGGSGAVTCILDGFEVGCGFANTLMSMGAAGQCPNNNCNPRMVDGVLRPLYLTEEGFGFWVPQKKGPKPTLKRPGQTRRRRVGDARRPRRTKGTPQGVEEKEPKPKYAPVTGSEINFVLLPDDPLRLIQDDIVNAIVDIANRQPCSDAFKKWGLTIPYDVVKSGNLKVAGLMALKQPNAGGLLGWSATQVGIAQERFDRQNRFIPWTRQFIAEGVFVGTPTVVFNATAVGMPEFGGVKTIVTHAFIHLGGEPGYDTAVPFDLDKFPGYKEIIDACK
jgi:hypothetical protein